MKCVLMSQIYIISYYSNHNAYVCANTVHKIKRVRTTLYHDWNLPVHTNQIQTIHAHMLDNILFTSLRHEIKIDLRNFLDELDPFTYHTMASMRRVQCTILCVVVAWVHDQTGFGVAKKVHQLRTFLQSSAFQPQMLLTHTHVNKQV